MKNNVTIKLVENEIEIIQILNLQSLNHKYNLSNEEKKQHGFLTVKHELEVLKNINHTAAQIIAVDNGVVIGYALVMLKSHRELIPILIPMFQMFEKILFNNQSLEDYYVMGQICIAAEYRGQKVFKKLYDMHKKLYAKEFKYCLTEISDSNLRSMSAHQKVGFQKIHTYQDQTDNWNIMLWDWK